MSENIVPKRRCVFRIRGFQHSFMPHPFLQLAELDLKFEQFLFVFLARKFRLLRSRLGGVLHQVIVH